jgi:hypothetical protein
MTSGEATVHPLITVLEELEAQMMLWMVKDSLMDEMLALLLDDGTVVHLINTP